ncbi:MAG: replication-associated recombination protein A [Polyangiaceae bacterium]
MKPSERQPSLLAARQSKQSGEVPLADRMRPRSLTEVVGQQQLIGDGKLLARAIRDDRLPSMILWGPPGSGKTTLAHVISEVTRSEFVPFSAVLGGVAELRTIIKEARERRDYHGKSTILFVDEIHRFNKSQQDAFLPHVENGTIRLIGATTENPSFAVNAAVLSRCRVFRLEQLSSEDIVRLLSRALSDDVRGLAAMQEPPRASREVLEAIAVAAQGDARRALGLLETAAALRDPEQQEIDLDVVEQAIGGPTLLYDKSGEEHYNVVSALIKSMRGSDPDAAIYWLMRMLEAGDDPLFVLRRLIIFASEDVGNADPRALMLVVNADQAFRRMGMPEGLYPIAHACLYLASCPKSNSVGRAFAAAREAIKRHGALPVPMSLRNASTKLMKQEGYGAGYQYPHDHAGNWVDANYLPETLEGARFYEPGDQGLEKAIGERLERLRSAKGKGPTS